MSNGPRALGIDEPAYHVRQMSDEEWRAAYEASIRENLDLLRALAEL